MAERAAQYFGGLTDKAAKAIKKDKERKDKILKRIQKETNPGAYKK